MDCSSVSQKLPWYLNETLDPEERTAVHDHLAGCPECQREMEETKEAFQVFGAHPPPDDLFAYARSGIASATDRDLLVQHLASCPACEEELSLIRQSFDSMEGEESSPRIARGPRWFSAGLAAAALIVIAMGLGWRQTWLRLQALRNAGANPGAMTAPQADFLVLNLFPEEMSQRSGTARLVELGNGGRGVALTLHSQLPPDSGPYRLELWSSLETKLWEAPVTRQADGTFTLILPEPFLHSDAISLKLFPASKDSGPEHYALRFAARGNR